MGRSAGAFIGLLALLLALAPLRSEAASWTIADTVFTHVAADSELPNGGSPFALAEDGDGFLWEGADDGLARYDGHDFRAYMADPGRPGSLPDSVILALHKDVRGHLWVGTGSGGLARYDRNDDRFVTYTAGPHGLSSASVAAIADDGVRGLWIGSEGGLDRLEFATGRIEHVRLASEVSKRLPNYAVRDVLVSRSGVLWVATNRGLLFRAPGATGFASLRIPVARGEGADVSRLFEDGAGRLWIGTSASGAYVAELAAPGERIARALHETHGKNAAGTVSPLDSENVTSFVQASPTEVWLGTIGDGIVAVNTQTFRTRRIRHDPVLPSSLLDDTVRVLYRDRAGLIWSGTDRSLNYTIVQSAVSTIFGASSRPGSLTDPNVEAILPVGNGRTWVGLGNSGVDVFGPQGRRVGGLRPDPRHPNSALASGLVYGLVRDASHVYLGTAKGLYEASLDGRRVARMTVAGHDASAQVTTLLASAGVLWFGGPDGVWKVRPTASGKNVVLAGPSSAQLTDRRVTALALGPRHFVWIGTRNGLNRYDSRKRTLERFVQGTGSTTLSSGFIACLLMDSMGRLWTGTQGGGIDIVERPGGRGAARFLRIGAAAGLPSANVDMLLEDGRGHMWASTDNGLAVIDERTLKVRALGSPDGVAISGYWWHAGARMPGGDLIFGGLGGMTVVRPRLLGDSNYHPPIVFTDIRVGGKSIAFSRYAAGSSNETLDILPGANSLAVGFSALEFSAPGQSTFAYRLDGLDKEWTFTDSSRRFADYTNLPPGHYTLHVRGTNREGAWTQRESVLAVHVFAAWWQTIWFRLLVALAVCGAIALLVYGRTRYLQGHQQELEREIAERTAELRESNAELAASTAELMKSKTRLESLAYIDGLTELPNRRMFTDRFESLIAQIQRSEDGRFALMLIDLDNFKGINDSLGHQAGDAVLIEAASRLRAVVRQSDIVARFGGDEFAILLVETTEWAGVEATARRIVDAFADPVGFREHAMYTTPSIGIAAYPQSGQTQNALYKAADLALYKAKHGGRNTWRWHVPEMIM